MRHSPASTQPSGKRATKRKFGRKQTLGAHRDDVARPPCAGQDSRRDDLVRALVWKGYPCQGLPRATCAGLTHITPNRFLASHNSKPKTSHDVDRSDLFLKAPAVLILGKSETPLL